MDGETEMNSVSESLEDLNLILDKFTAFLKTIPIEEGLQERYYKRFLENNVQYKAFLDGQSKDFDFNGLKRNVAFFFHDDIVLRYLKSNTIINPEEYINNYGKANGIMDEMISKKREGTFYYSPKPKEEKKKTSSSNRPPDFNHEQYEYQTGFFSRFRETLMVYFFNIPSNPDHYFFILDRFNKDIARRENNVKTIADTIALMLQKETNDYKRYINQTTDKSLHDKFLERLNFLDLEFKKIDDQFQKAHVKRRKIEDSYRPQIDRHYNDWLIHGEENARILQKRKAFYDSIAHLPNKKLLDELEREISEQERQHNKYYTVTEGSYGEFVTLVCNQSEEYKKVQGEISRLNDIGYEKQTRFNNYKNNPEQAKQEIKNNITQEYFKEKDKQIRERKRKEEQKASSERKIAQKMAKKKQFIEKYQITFDQDGFWKRAGADPNSFYGNNYQNGQAQYGNTNQSNQRQRRSQRR